MTMKQIIFGSVIAILLFGFFVEQAFAQVIGANGGTAAGRELRVEQGVTVELAQSGNTINGKNSNDANGHSRGAPTSGP